MIPALGLAALFLAVSQVNAQAKDCPKGSYEYRGDCVLDIQPETAKSVQPSDEKPPKDKMPSYQREGVKVLMPDNLASRDEKANGEKAKEKEWSGVK